jgi:acetyl-CoA carboxylase carboxyl transferase subunit alpha
VTTICQKFIELHGDRCAGDDHAIVGGLADLDGQTVMVIGHQKGVNTKMRQYRNFGMANPEGYRKALRLMKMAERFGFPVVTLIDTPGAFPGLEAEQRGQAEAIARNLFEMAQLRVPILVLCHRRRRLGRWRWASGWATGCSCLNTPGTRLFRPNPALLSYGIPGITKSRPPMRSNSTPTTCSFGLIDGIVKEPLGGGHNAPEEMAETLKQHIKAELAKLTTQDPEERIVAELINTQKYSNVRLMGLSLPLILAYKADVRVASFYGFFGLHELSEPASFMLTIVVIVGIVNAFNFIDGINGLGGSVGLLTCLVFGTCLHLMGALALAVVAFSLAGATLAFLWYNFSPAKIFMGDTGSLLMGTVCAILAITFIETNHKLPPGDPYILGAAPAIAVAVLILPLYDTLSVIMRRILRGRSPFSPDKTHIHHQLLRCGLSHSSTTGVLIGVNLLFICVAFGFNRCGLFTVLLLEFVLAVVFSLVLFLLPRFRLRNKK